MYLLKISIGKIKLKKKTQYEYFNFMKKKGYKLQL